MVHTACTLTCTYDMPLHARHMLLSCRNCVTHTMTAAMYVSWNSM